MTVRIDDLGPKVFSHGEMRNSTVQHRLCDRCGVEMKLGKPQNTGDPASMIAPPYKFELGKDEQLAVFWQRKGEIKDCCKECTLELMIEAQHKEAAGG